MTNKNKENTDPVMMKVKFGMKVLTKVDSSTPHFVPSVQGEKPQNNPRII